MSKSFLSLFASVLIAFLAFPVVAQDREVVGFTVATTDGDNNGFVGMHALCESEFPGSRMCTTADIVRNGLAQGLSVFAVTWVHPSIQVFAPSGNAIDAISGARPGTSSISCTGWTDDDSELSGMTLTSEGFFPGGCEQSRSVACCAELKKLKQ